MELEPEVLLVASGPDPLARKASGSECFAASVEGSTFRFCSGLIVSEIDENDVLIVAPAASLLPFLHLPPRQRGAPAFIDGMQGRTSMTRTLLRLCFNV